MNCEQAENVDMITNFTGITALGLFFTLMADRRKPYDNFDENAELLRKAKIFKRKTWLEKNY